MKRALCLAAGLALLAQVGEQVAYGQTFAHVALVEFTAARIEYGHALFHQTIGQWHVAADHQLARLRVLDQIIIRRVRTAWHDDQANQGEGRLDLALTSHQQHLELAFEGELYQLLFRCPGTGVRIDPDPQRAAGHQTEARCTVASRAAAPANILAKLRLTRRC